jgi:hypothetical protein
LYAFRVLRFGVGVHTNHELRRCNGVTSLQMRLHLKPKKLCLLLKIFFAGKAATHG